MQLARKVHYYVDEYQNAEAAFNRVVTDTVEKVGGEEVVRQEVSILSRTVSQISSFAEKACIVLFTILLSGFLIFLLTQEVDPYAGDDNPLARKTWYPVYLITLFFLASKFKPLVMASWRFMPLLLLMVLTVLSTKWSVMPEITERRAIAVCLSMFFAIYLAVRAPFKQTMQLMGYGLIFMVIVHFVIILAMPARGIDSDVHVGAWQGMAHQKNQMGGEMAMASLIFLSLFGMDKPRRILWGGAFVLAAILVLGSTSKTSLLGLMVGCFGTWLFWVSRGGPFWLILCAWGAGVGSVAVVTLGAFAPEVLVAIIGRDLTFTGRTDIWIIILTLMATVPFTGFGYGAFWKDELGPSYYIINVLEWDVPTAHNSWLEIGLSLGFPGMALIITIFLAAIGLGVRKLVQHGEVWPVLMIAQTLVFTLSESILWTPNNFVSVYVTFVIAHIFLGRDAPGPRGYVDAAPVAATPINQYAYTVPDEPAILRFRPDDWRPPIHDEEDAA